MLKPKKIKIYFICMINSFIIRDKMAETPLKVYVSWRIIHFNTFIHYTIFIQYKTNISFINLIKYIYQLFIQNIHKRTLIYLFYNIKRWIIKILIAYLIVYVYNGWKHIKCKNIIKVSIDIRRIAHTLIKSGDKHEKWIFYHFFGFWVILGCVGLWRLPQQLEQIQTHKTGYW